MDSQKPDEWYMRMMVAEAAAERVRALAERWAASPWEASSYGRDVLAALDPPAGPQNGTEKALWGLTGGRSLAEAPDHFGPDHLWPDPPAEPEAEAPQPKVVDLMEALERSVAEAKADRQRRQAEAEAPTCPECDGGQFLGAPCDRCGGSGVVPTPTETERERALKGEGRRRFIEHERGLLPKPPTEEP